MGSRSAWILRSASFALISFDRPAPALSPPSASPLRIRRTAPSTRPPSSDTSAAVTQPSRVSSSDSCTTWSVTGGPSSTAYSVARLLSDVFSLNSASRGTVPMLVPPFHPKIMHTKLMP
ncbi:hypothetical protein G6F68_020362 [Rhizopus microsporus]|uniref:Uncharacterized protein n=1 Tax=Rhizopus delemar TaxID=936053 RepID=A0A9P6XTA0_9FUNG|nr:hypothetical protein G6F68_020362 [Rhizopus microsporus]KAG1532073.1 hypothetical protein G6F50_016364 [Rhizopus delemar]